MTQIAIVADIHAGVQGRTQDILWALRTAREYCHATKIDTVLILGDLWHDRHALEIDVLVGICEFFAETREKYEQHWITFPGNHDMFLRHSWQVNSLQALRKHLTVIEDVKLLTINDQRFWVLPFITYEKPYMTILSKIHEKHEEGDILLTHIGVKNASLNTCFLLQNWSMVTFEESLFTRVYAGHFHSKQQVGTNLWYPGSLIPFKFDEGGISHGFYVYDLGEKTHKFINIWKAGARFFPDVVPPPQFYTVHDTELDQFVTSDTVSNDASLVKHNLIRVALSRDYGHDEQKQIRTKLLEMGAKDVRWLNAKPKSDIELPDNVVVERQQTHLDFFRIWKEVDIKNIKKLQLDLSLLNRLNIEVVHDGDEQYVMEDSEVI